MNNLLDMIDYNQLEQKMNNLTSAELILMFIEASTNGVYKLVSEMIRLNKNLVYVIEAFHNILKYYNNTEKEEYLRLSNEFVSMGADPNNKDDNGKSSFDIITKPKLKKIYQETIDYTIASKESY
jgi:hypothetical protein